MRTGFGKKLLSLALSFVMTLTLDGFNNKAQYFEINNMGSDFKIKLKNGNAAGILEVFGGSVRFVGGGALSVNPDGSATMYFGYYSGPIAVSGSMMVKAIAVKIGSTPSGAETAEITQRAAGTRSDGSPVSVDPTPAPVPPRSGSGSSPAPVTVALTGGAEIIRLNVTVSGGTARVAALSGADAAKAVGTGGGSVNVVMDRHRRLSHPPPDFAASGQITPSLRQQNRYHIQIRYDSRCFSASWMSHSQKWTRTFFPIIDTIP